MRVIRWCQRWWRSFSSSSGVVALLHSPAFLIILSKLRAVHHSGFRACIVNVRSLVNVGVCLFAFMWSIPVYPSHLIKAFKIRRSESEYGNPVMWLALILPLTIGNRTVLVFFLSMLSMDCHILFTNKRIKQWNKWPCVCSWAADLRPCVAQLVLNGANLTTVGALILTVATQIVNAATHYC